MGYIKKTWKTGEAITASALNNLEEGVTEAKKEASQCGVSANNAQTAATNAQTAAANAAKAAQGAQTALNDHVGSEEAHPDIREAVSNLEERVTPVDKGGTGNTTGVAPTATKLATPRTIQVNLESTEATSFDGSANIAPGVKGILPSNRGGTGNSVGRAPSAYKLAIPRTIQVDLSSEDGASFDGSANIAPGVKGVLPVKLGGHGGTDAAGARQNLGVPSVEEMMQRDRAWNVLDNSDFSAARFIASAGLNGKHGSVLYLGDRWRGNVSITATQQTDGVLLTASEQSTYIYQKVSVKAGQKYTLAIYATGLTGTHRIAAYNANNSIIYAQDYASDRNTLIVNFTAGEDVVSMLYYPGYTSNGGSAVLHWAVLYEGTYTADTLPAYVYKGYAAELAECQRYYIKIAAQPVSGWCYNWGRATMLVQLPVTMRTASPTVTVTSESLNFYIGSTAYAAEPTGGTAVSNGITVYFSHSHTGNGQCVMPEFSAEISADL